MRCQDDNCAGRRQQSNGPRQRARAVAPEYGGGREYDIEAEFMNELGPLPKARPDDGDGGKITISTELDSRYFMQDMLVLLQMSSYHIVTTAVKSLNL